MNDFINRKKEINERMDGWIGGGRREMSGWTEDGWTDGGTVEGRIGYAEGWMNSSPRCLLASQIQENVRRSQAEHDAIHDQSTRVAHEVHTLQNKMNEIEFRVLTD